VISVGVNAHQPSVSATIAEAFGNSRDGISPFLAGLLCLSPFLASALGLLLWDLAIITSSGLAFTLLFALGVFLGRV